MILKEKYNGEGRWLAAQQQQQLESVTTLSQHWATPPKTAPQGYTSKEYLHLPTTQHLPKLKDHKTRHSSKVSSICPTAHFYSRPELLQQWIVLPYELWKDNLLSKTHLPPPPQLLRLEGASSGDVWHNSSVSSLPRDRHLHDWPPWPTMCKNNVNFSSQPMFKRFIYFWSCMGYLIFVIWQNKLCNKTA